MVYRFLFLFLPKTAVLRDQGMGAPVSNRQRLP